MKAVIERKKFLGSRPTRDIEPVLSEENIDEMFNFSMANEDITTGNYSFVKNIKDQNFARISLIREFIIKRQILHWYWKLKDVVALQFFVKTLALKDATDFV